MTTAILAQHARPGEARSEWTQPFPKEWMRRLREISPVSESTSYLWPRWRRESDAEGGGQWLLYDVAPARILDPGRIAQLSVHWSTLPLAEQHGRKRFVSEYQFWMFLTHRLDARPFWALQGTQFITGGTPVSFTARERRILAASHEGAEPIPPGTLPNIPFDERVVRAIQARDRLIKAGMSLDALEQMDRPQHLRAEDEAIEKEHRKAFLDWHEKDYAPAAAFMGWFAKRREASWKLPEATGPAVAPKARSDFRDAFIEHGVIEGGRSPSSRKLQIAVV